MKRIITFALALILLLLPGVEMRAGAQATSLGDVTATNASPSDASHSDASYSDVSLTDATPGDAAEIASPTQLAPVATSSEANSDVPEYGRGSLPVNYTPPEYYPAIALNEALPSRYDARTLGYLSPIRNQDPYGTCWTFSMSGTAEANILKKYGTPTELNISELQISYLTNNGAKKSDGTYNDPLNLFGGDRNKLVGTHRIIDGGNVLFCVNTVASWMGIAQEDDTISYTTANAENIMSNGLDYAYAFEKDTYHLTDARITTIANMSGVKSLVMQYGAASLDYPCGNYGSHQVTAEGEYYGHHTYYQPVIDSSCGGHAVCIVGWDDNYPKENFNYSVSNQRSTPVNNGAWLIRNSWGTSSNDDGYFWMSYENTFQSHGDVIAWDYEFSDNYDRCYQYDGSSSINQAECASQGTPLMMANVFTATNAEQLCAVSFQLFQSAGVEYEISVYTGVEGADPLSGKLEAQKSGLTSYAGYYTVKLDAPVALSANQKFAVVIKFVSQSGQLAVSVDGSETDSANWLAFYAHASAGQSYMKAGNAASWTDISANGKNARIKAFTRDSTDFTRGDVNNDKKVDLVDAILICKHISNSPALTGAALLAADVNRDGAVNFMDVLAISEYIAAKRTL